MTDPSPSPAGYRHVVVGAGGFIGRALCRRLGKAGSGVLALDQAGVAIGVQGVMTSVAPELGDREGWSALLEPGDVVHLLAGGSLPDDRGADTRAQLDATVGATLSFLDACATARVARVMFPSSGGTVYGAPLKPLVGEDHPTDPISAYGVQKLAIEKYLAVYRRQRGLDSIIMRIGNPYGPGQDPARGQGLIAAVIQRVLAGQAIEIWGDGEVVRDYLFIDDLADAMVVLATYRGAERVFNVGAGAGRSVNEVVAAIAGAMPDLEMRIERKPARGFDVPVNVLDISRLTRETGWSAQSSFHDGISQTIAWVRGARGGAA